MMKNWQITGFLTIMILGFLLMSGCTSTAPSITPLPTITSTTSIETTSEPATPDIATTPPTVVPTDADYATTPLVSPTVIIISTTPVTPAFVPASTTTSSEGGINITQINPDWISASNQYLPITVYGSNFQDGIKAKLTRKEPVGTTSDIVSYTIIRMDTTHMRCFFTIPEGSEGSWSLVLTNSDGTTGTLENGFVVYGDQGPNIFIMETTYLVALTG
jgi:hypothetical protein